MQSRIDTTFSRMDNLWPRDGSCSLCFLKGSVVMDFDIVFSPMSDETMSWLDELFSTCKRFGVDYYNASEKDRVFVEAVARKNYGLKQASATGKAASTVEPFFGIHRAV